MGMVTLLCMYGPSWVSVNHLTQRSNTVAGGVGACDGCIVKLLPLPHPPVRARTDAGTTPSAQRATQLTSVLARVYAVSIQNQITTTVAQL
jgi:hypothetical protein